MPAPSRPIDAPLSALADPPDAPCGELCHARALLLGAEDERLRREHLRLSAERDPEEPTPVLLCRCLVLHPLRALFPQQRYRLLSLRRRKRRLQCHGRLCAHPGFAGKSLVLMLFLSCM